MKPKTMILLVVAVSCGLAASYMTSKLLAERKGPPPEEKVPVLIAKVKVPKTTVLKEPDKFFEVKLRLKSEAPKQYFSDLKDIKDKRVNREIKPDVHISPEDVADKMVGLPIPDGYEAVGLKITATSAVSFFVTPGDKVDIILTQRGDNASSAKILEEMLVLSVGDATVRKEDSGQSGAMQAQTVTVAVKGEEAQLIRLAETVGDLSLSLLKEGDSTGPQKPTKVITKADLQRVGKGVALGHHEPPPVDPNKLPLGLDLAKIDQAKKDDEKEPEPEPIKPIHTIVIENGAAPPVFVPFYQRPDGSVTKDPNLAQPEPKKETKKPEPKKETKKPEPKKK